MFKRKGKNFEIQGFNLVEVLIYVAVFAGLAFFIVNIFISSTTIQKRQASLNELNYQVDFILGYLERLISQSSLIENQSGIATTSLVLRVASSSIDKVIVYFDESKKTIYFQEGNNSPVALNSSKVLVRNFKAVKYESPRNRAVVQIDLILENNIDNPNLKFKRSIQTVFGRVSAATFDSNLLPYSSGMLDIGSGSNFWRYGYFSNGLGIGTSAIGAAKLAIENGDIFLKTPGRGLILKAQDGNCYKIGIDQNGSVTSTLVTCP